jgi:hypothetical protein
MKVEFNIQQQRQVASNQVQVTCRQLMSKNRTTTQQELQN